MAMEVVDPLRTYAMESGVDVYDQPVEAAPQTAMEATITIPGIDRDVYVVRAHRGDPDTLDDEGRFTTIGKGGMRMKHFATPAHARQEAYALSEEMWEKIEMGKNDHDWHGAKLVIDVDPNELSDEQIAAALEATAEQMHKAGLAHYLADVPAGDNGTNQLVDHYKIAKQLVDPFDEYAAACVTGKTLKHGGLAERPGATGVGVYAAIIAAMNEEGRDTASYVLPGFGNVGAYLAWRSSLDYFEGRDQRLRVHAISDADGTISLPEDHPLGFLIDEDMLNEIGNARSYAGQKIEELYNRLRLQHSDIEYSPDSRQVYQIETDLVVPASPQRNVINGQNVADSLRFVRWGYAEAANGPLDRQAYLAAVAAGKLVLPGEITNSMGVEASLEEWRKNVAEVNHSRRQRGLSVVRDVEFEPTGVNDRLIGKQQHKVARVYEMRRNLGTHDMRGAMKAVIIDQRASRRRAA